MNFFNYENSLLTRVPLSANNYFRPKPKIFEQEGLRQATSVFR
jgi:hypothetical protein